MIKVAINGFGRIGRLAFRQMITKTDFDIVAINDLSHASDLAYLLKYDTVHGRFHTEEIKSEENYIVINNQKKIPVFAESDPKDLPWKEMGVDLVLECTGHFTDYEGALKHIEAGAKKVLISAPSKSENVKTIVYGVNENILNGDEVIVSAASCTTNCLAPVLNVLQKNFGIVKGFMSTIHAYTNDQTTLDLAHKKGYLERRGRACASNIVPTKTGAASAIGKVMPELDGLLSGLAYRVPVNDGSLIDLTVEVRTDVTEEQINEAFKNSESEVLKTTNDPIVSSDVLGLKIGALVDLSLTKVIKGDGFDIVKVMAWYDNEAGYTSQMLRTAKALFATKG